MSYGKSLVLVGMVLIVVAWLLASGMPEAAIGDFDKLIHARGGMSHTPAFPDEYRKLAFTRRLMQNCLLGLAGLICLGIGLDAYRREPATQIEESGVPAGPRTQLQPAWRHLFTGVAVLAFSVVLWMVVLLLQA